MAGRRPQPVTQAANPAPMEMPSLVSQAVMPTTSVGGMTEIGMPSQMPVTMAGAPQQATPPVARPTPMQYGAPPQQHMGGFGPGINNMFGGSPFMSQPPQGPAYGGPRVTNGKNGGYRPQPYNPFGGGGFGGGCNH